MAVTSRQAWIRISTARLSTTSMSRLKTRSEKKDIAHQLSRGLASFLRAQIRLYLVEESIDYGPKRGVGGYSIVNKAFL